jgi:hypothetical protein
MSQLRVFCPDDEVECSGGEPRAFVVRFPGLPQSAARSGSRVLRGTAVPQAAVSTISELPEPVRRARMLFQNRCCPVCQYPVVHPLELTDAARNRRGRIIPGTATLVGFHCNGCGHEWRAE